MGGFVWSFNLQSGLLQEQSILIVNDIVMLQDSQKEIQLDTETEDATQLDATTKQHSEDCN
jgi:hypothetical protein